MQDALGSAATTEHMPPARADAPILAQPPTASSLHSPGTAFDEPPPIDAPLQSGLGTWVQKCWYAFESFKVRIIQPELAECQRLRNSTYDTEQTAEYAQNGISPAFFPLTAAKCSHAAAWFRESLTDRPFGITPSALPSLPDDVQHAIIEKAVEMVMQASAATGQPPTAEMAFAQASELRDQRDADLMTEALRRCKRMEDLISDDMRDAGFDDEFDGFIDDLVTYHTAFMMDEVRMVKRRQWNGNVMEIVDEPMLCPVRVSPWDVYPSPLCGGIGDGGVIIRRNITKEALCKMIGVPNYNNDAIASVIRQQSSSMIAMRPYDTDRLTGEDKDTVAVSGSADERIQMLTYFGTVRGEWLIEWDEHFRLPDGKPVVPDMEYPCCVIVAGQTNTCIKAMLNPDMMGRWPLYASSFYPKPGSIWGDPPPLRMKPLQRPINAAFRNLIDNIGYACSPQMEAELDRLLPQSVKAVYQLVPKRVLLTKPALMNNNPAMRYQQMELRARELVFTINAFLDYVDELTGIPRFISGDNRGQPETASGLQMLMNAASKTIRQAIGRTGKQVVAKMIERRADLINADPDADPEVKGDCDIKPSGVLAILVRDEVARRQTELMQTIFSNPVLMNDVGPMVRLRMLRERAKQAQWPDLIPQDAELRQRFANQQSQAPQPGQPPQGGASNSPPTPQPAGAPSAPQPATMAA